MGNTQQRILIVDDDVLLGNVLRQALKLSNETYDVRLASNADEALAQISRRDFDLIITDIRMEGFSGLQLLEALRQVAPNTRTVAMTAFGTPDIEERARTLGVYDYITKPFTTQDFRNLVGAALEAKATTTPEKLPISQLKAVNKTLADLRANTGAQAAFFIEETADVLGVASDTNNLDLTSLAKALVEITQRMTAEVARIFGGGSGFRRSQYEGETFNLTAYRLPGEGLLILVYGHHVKEGIVSFYSRQALEALAQTLQKETFSETLSDTRPQDDASSPATTFPSQTTTPEFTSKVEPDSDTEEETSETLSLEQAMVRGLLKNDFFQSLEEETQE
jgi:CheY-like chemotaxis protein